MTKEMEALADKICKEELGQEPNENNLTFRKTLVHGMVRWDEQSKVKKFHKPLVIGSGCPNCKSANVTAFKKFRTCEDCGWIWEAN